MSNVADRDQLCMNMLRTPAMNTAAAALGKAVQAGEVERGMLICGSGVGASAHD